MSSYFVPGKKDTSPEGYAAINAPLNSSEQTGYNGTASTPPVVYTASRRDSTEYSGEKKTKETDSNVSWRKFANQDRFYHSQIETAAKVNGKEIGDAAKQKKEDNEQEKQNNKGDEKKTDGTAETDVESSLVSSAGASSDIHTPKKSGHIPLDSTGSRTSLGSMSMYSDGGSFYDDSTLHQTTKPGHTRKESQAVVERPKFPETNSKEYAYFKPKDKKKPGRRIVFFDGKLKRVSKIDTCEETFHVVFHYYFTWLMSKKEVEEYYEAKATEENFKTEWEPHWHPEIEIDNIVEGDMERKGGFKIKEGYKFTCLKKQNPAEDFSNGWGWTSFDISREDLGFDPRWAFWCRTQYECKFTCAEEMELEMFPFDCQDLSVVMRSSKKANECDLLPFPRHGEIFNIDARYSMVSEWKVPGVMLEFIQGDPKSAKNGIPYNSVILRVKAERKWEAHMADSVTIFCMFWLGLATFGMPVEDVGDRLAYWITLLLTDVATMQLLNESIPNIPYRTFLDTYTYACFLFLVGVTIWVTLAGWNGDKNLGHDLDWYAFWFCAGLVCLMHLQFAYSIWQGKTKERAKLKLDTEGLEQWFEEMSHEGSISAVPCAAVSWDSRSIRGNPSWVQFCNEKKIPLLDFTTSWSGLSYPWSRPGEEQFEKVDPFRVQPVRYNHYEQPSSVEKRP